MEQDGNGTWRPGGNAVLALAIVVAAAILSFNRSDDEEPRYQLVASGDSVVRMDTDSGAMIACNRAGCTEVQPPARAVTAKSIRLALPGGKSETAR